MNPNTPPNPNPAAAAAGSEHLLDCGRSVEQVWQEMETGQISAHTTTCPYCATARASLTQLVEATALLVNEPVEPPTGLLDKIMAAVRADLGQGGAVVLPSVSGTPTSAARVEISTHALAAVLRYVVDAVPGLRAHRCRIESVPEIPHTVRVEMSVSLHYGAGRFDTLDQARDRIHAALSQRIGLRLAGLDLQLVDVWIDDLPDPGRPA